MYKKFLILLLFLTIGCTNTLKVTKEPPLNYEKTPSYVLDISNLPKIDPLNPIMLDKNFKETNIKEDVYYLAFSSSEMNKIKAILQKGKVLKNITIEQEKLINLNIDNQNSLKEYVVLERMKANEYRMLWADSENAYREEKMGRSIDNLINRGMIAIFILETIVIIILLV